MVQLTKWLNRVVKAFLLAFALNTPVFLCAQELRTFSLQEAFRIAEQQYPLNQQKGLLKQTKNLALKNLNSSYLPQLTVNGQVSYQSDVTRISIPLPGIKIPEQSKDQYRAIAEVSQLLYDGGLVKNQKNIQLLTTRVDAYK